MRTRDGHDAAPSPCMDGTCLRGQIAECRDLALECMDYRAYRMGSCDGGRERRHGLTGREPYTAEEMPAALARRRAEVRAEHARTTSVRKLALEVLRRRA